MTCMTKPSVSKSVATKRAFLVQAALAEEVIIWLIQEYSRRCQASPGSPRIEILRSLVKERLEGDLEPSEVVEALHQLEKAPFLLETAVLILKLRGSWPEDPESVFLVHAEILVAILEFAPEYSIPWAVMAREPLSN